MGRKCFVPYCRSGYKTRDSVTLFSCPNDPEGMKKWSDAVARLDRSLRQTDCICEKHFKEEDIVRYWRAFDQNGKEVMKVAYKRLRLRSGAVPCYFPVCSSGFSCRKKRSALRDDVKKKSIKAKASESFNTDVLECPSVTGDIFEDERGYAHISGISEAMVEGFDELYDSCVVVEEGDCRDNGKESVNKVKYSDLLERAQLFEDIWEDSQTVSLPSKSWAVFRLEGDRGRRILITQMGFSEGSAPVPVKQVCLDEEMNVELYLKSNKLHCEEMNISLPKMCTVLDVSTFVQSVDGLLDWD